MGKLKLYAFLIVAAIVLIEVTLFFIPVPANVTDVQAFKSSFLVVSLFSAFYFAAALMFLFGLADFRQEMRKSYIIITASMAFFGIVNLQYPVLLYAGLIPGEWTTYGGSLLIIIPGVIMHYAGIRKMATSLKLNSRFLAVSSVLFAIAVASIGVVFLPHIKEIPELWFGVHQIGATINLVLNIFTTVIVCVILQVVGSAYKTALRWFLAALILSSLGFLHIIIAALFGQNNAYTEQGLTAVPFIIVALMYFISGYYFSRIRFYKAKPDSGFAIVDAIVTIAALASNKNEIDEPLDKMRKMTASLNRSHPLSATESAELIKIYLQIEDYLVKKERLKSFTQNSLRARLSSEAIRIIENS